MVEKWFTEFYRNLSFNRKTKIDRLPNSNFVSFFVSFFHHLLPRLSMDKVPALIKLFGKLKVEGIALIFRKHCNDATTLFIGSFVIILALLGCVCKLHSLTKVYDRNISTKAGANVRSASKTVSSQSSLNKIITKLNKQGYIYWLTEEGKIITKNTDGEKALSSLYRKIKKNKDEYEGKTIIKIKYIVVGPQDPMILDGSIGPIQMGIYIHKVTYLGKNLSIAPLEDHHAIRFHYFEKDLRNFKLGDMKMFTLGLLKNREHINTLHFYTYDEAIKLLKS